MVKKTIMNKKIIYELERAREIMGLKQPTNNLITEQRDDIVKFFQKLFTKKGGKEISQALADRMIKLVGKEGSQAVANVFDRMTRKANVKFAADGETIIALVGRNGELYDMATIKKVMTKVADGSLSGKQLDDFLAWMPYFLKNGDGFATSFSKQMKLLEAKVQKEIAEKLEKEAIEKAEREAIEKAEKEAVDLTTLKSTTWLETFTKDLKAFIWKTKSAGASGTKQKVFKAWIDDPTNGVTNLKSLQKELTELASQSTHTLPRSVDELVALIGRAIEKDRVIPPEVLDDLIGILSRSDQQDNIIKLIWKNSDAATRRAAKNGTLDDAALRTLLGGEKNATTDLISMLRNMLKDKFTVGGTLLKIIPKTKKGLMYTALGITGAVLIDQLIQSLMTLTASNKSIAGATEQLYKKFQGNKDAIYQLGGLSDSEAEALADKLHVYLRGYMVVRDFDESDDMTELINKYAIEDDAGKKTIAGIPNKDREAFRKELIGEMARYSDTWVFESNTFLKWITGVDDWSIEAVIDAAPTVLAMSQIVFFYNKIGKTKFIDDLGLMNKKIPLIGLLINLVTTDKGDALDWIGEKSWVVGSDSDDDSLDKAAKMLTDFWPEYAETRENERGQTVYGRYKPEALISTDNLSRLAMCNDYKPEGDATNKWSNDFQEFLNGLTSEDFNKGQCCNKTGGKCPEVYFTTDPDHEDVGKRSGAAIKDIQLEFSNIIKDLTKAFQEGGFGAVRDQINEWNEEDKKEDKKEEKGRNPSPNIYEGLINVLNTK